ncbi:MAG: DUF3135 domain-containing protein [Gammaproteobacteria bacterium]|nr:DUF3135 domain-containing protein [Gammaproteobacteria bacterium]
MDNQLPEIDELLKMAENSPDQLEELRQKLCAQLIENAPEHYQKRLNGLQFQIDMERRKSNNPMHCCIKISEMMLDSYQELKTAISSLDKAECESDEHSILPKYKFASSVKQASAEIIDFDLAKA